MTVQFQLLGDVAAYLDGRPVDTGHARQRCVLAVLLVDANSVVPADRLLEQAWGDRLPQRARNTLSGYVSRLRQALARTGEVSIARRPGGYQLTVDPAAVDLHRFDDLLTRTRLSGDAGIAAELLDQALAQWRGSAFGTLDTPWLNILRDSLHSRRLMALLDRNDLRLRRGGHAALLGEVSTLAATHPFDERVAGQLILTLYRCGRQADALHHYQQLRTRLADELGADPIPALQQLHRQILTADPALTAPNPDQRLAPGTSGGAAAAAHARWVFWRSSGPMKVSMPHR